MLRKKTFNKYLKLSILIVFCLFSATIGGPLLYGSNIHLGHHSVHIHHNEAAPCLDEENCGDSKVALYFDYLVTADFNSTKKYPGNNLYFISFVTYDGKTFNIHSSTISYSSINGFCPSTLYQLNSSFLI